MRTEKLYYGAAYYDEYMPTSRVAEDMRMMKDAGMNVIRIAESTWSTWEPGRANLTLPVCTGCSGGPKNTASM